MAVSWRRRWVAEFSRGPPPLSSSSRPPPPAPPPPHLSPSAQTRWSCSCARSAGAWSAADGATAPSRSPGSASGSWTSESRNSYWHISLWTRLKENTLDIWELIKTKKDLEKYFLKYSTSNISDLIHTKTKSGKYFLKYSLPNSFTESCHCQLMQGIDHLLFGMRSRSQMTDDSLFLR